MSTLSEFDAPNFGEVIAYLHGVADGIRASHSGTASLTTCDAGPPAPCRAAEVVVGSGRDVCDEARSLPIVRRRMSNAPQVVDTSWPRPANGQESPWLDSSVRSNTTGSGRQRTMPYLSSAVSVEPPNAFPADDRTSGVCLRVVPPSTDWYRLTGTDDDPGFHPQGR
jgi:hypothetical protein